MPPYDMNLYRAIRNCMTYWYARIILEQNANDALGYSCGTSGDEVRAIARYQKRRLYWRQRAAGASSWEARAALSGTTAAHVKKMHRASRARRNALYGGYPDAGTEARNRWLLATR